MVVLMAMKRWQSRITFDQQTSIWNVNISIRLHLLSTNHHGVDDDYLQYAGGAEDPVVDVAEAAVHQGRHHPAQPLLSLPSLNSPVMQVARSG